MKSELKDFNKTHFGGLSGKVMEKRIGLDAVQLSVLSNSPNVDLVKLVKSLLHELQELMLAEEELFQTKIQN